VAINLARPSHLETFAQDEQAWGWLIGITDEVRTTVIQHWSEWVRSIRDRTRDDLANVVAGLSPEQLDQAADLFANLAEGRFREFLGDMDERQVALYLGPMLESVAALPKDELGVLAESLVNLTSLKQRVSIFDANTVGGAIDVAIISMGDGFVWVNRKHYFSPELNPAWHLTHSAMLDGRFREEG
jgi:hypothetical protein